ncbi:MAG: putative transport system permease protein, partial [Thermoleophilaceae bacterium]|nr:putative transport system permease protein [Thermoleophilaceae bacterium]
MLVLTWVRGLLARRRTRVLSTAAGVAVGVALLASIGTFLSATTSQMTGRAVARVAVDWQVQAQPAAKPSRVLATVRHSPGVTRALPVQFAETSGMNATTSGSTQRTGPGKVLGIPTGYTDAFPGQIRTLAGSGRGVLLAQQTAANLRAKPGDTVSIARVGRPAAHVRVDGVVDLPAADSLFQQVGAPAGSQPQAPPDNVILIPAATFARIEAGANVTTQVHATLSRALPGSPGAAFTVASG